MLKWLRGKTVNQEKPRLVRRGATWYCAIGGHRYESFIVYKGSLGQGASPTEAYWNWRAQ